MALANSNLVPLLPCDVNSASLSTGRCLSPLDFCLHSAWSSLPSLGSFGLESHPLGQDPFYNGLRSCPCCRLHIWSSGLMYLWSEEVQWLSSSSLLCSQKNALVLLGGIWNLWPVSFPCQEHTSKSLRDVLEAPLLGLSMRESAFHTLP